MKQTVEDKLIAEAYSKVHILKDEDFSSLNELNVSAASASMPAPGDDDNKMHRDVKALQIAGKMAKLQDEIVQLKKLNAPFVDEDNQWKNLARELINIKGSASSKILRGERERYPRYRLEPPDMTGLQ